MKKLIIILLLFIAGSSCKNAEKTIGRVTELRFADNTVAGWLENKDRYATFDTGNFYNLIDGGAPAYDEQGLVDGFTQSFVQVIPPDTFTCQLYVMDFATPVNAGHMFNKIKSGESMPVAVPGYDTTVAMANAFLGGYFAFAIFDRFYIEVSVSGYADPVKALSDAKSFIDVFKGRIQDAAISF